MWCRAPVRYMTLILDDAVHENVFYYRAVTLGHWRGNTTGQIWARVL